MCLKTGADGSVQGLLEMMLVFSGSENCLPQNLEAMSHAIYSCERVMFEEDKKTAGASSAEPVVDTAE